MSDPSTGVSASGGDSSTAKQVAQQGAQAAGTAASEVKDTAAQQAQRVGHEAKAQARNVAGEVRDKLGETARTQNDRLVSTIRQTADQLDEMRGDRGDSPAAAVVTRVADGGRQFADYLDRHGPDGVLREVQDFARRRPGAFLATALAAGFVVGRLGKGVAKADDVKPTGDAYQANAYQADTYEAYPPVPVTTAPVTPVIDPAVDPVIAPPAYPPAGSGTQYASTGTGTPAVIDPEVTPLSTQDPRP